jgi:serine/threonine protein kinase
MNHSDPTVCPSCASQNPADSDVCANCGAPLIAPAGDSEVAELIAELTSGLAGSYALGRVLGSGRGGVVVEARHLATRRVVALKVAWKTNAARRQIVRENVLSSKVRHPNVVQMRDVPAPEPLLVVEMPLLAGGNLAQVIGQHGAIPFANVVAILRAVAGALDEAHAAGIMHGGLEPSKIILNAEGRAFVSDFAIRVPQLANWDVSRPSEAGAQAYMPLEQRHDAPNMDGRIDQYALAIIAYELLRGHATWRFGIDGSVQIDPIEIIVHRPIAPDAPLSAGAAIKRAVSKDPGYRFVSAGEFLRSFSGATETPVAAEQMHSSDAAATPKRKLSKAWFLVPVALGIGGVVAVPEVRSAAVDIVSGLLPTRAAPEDTTFSIDTTVVLPTDSSKKGAKGKKTAADSGRRKRAGGDVTTIPEFDESVLMISVDGDANAQVLVDGHARGQSPVTVKVPSGQHLVSVRGSRKFSPNLLTIIVASGDTARAKFKPLNP